MALSVGIVVQGLNALHYGTLDDRRLRICFSRQNVPLSFHSGMRPTGTLISIDSSIRTLCSDLCTYIWVPRYVVRCCWPWKVVEIELEFFELRRYQALGLHTSYYSVLVQSVQGLQG